MKPTFNKRAQENNPEGPFDVLLQLLFPITLILAFVVVTELGVWKRQYTELYAQTITTPQGISNHQRQRAVITLQEQLLLRAVRETFEKEAAELHLSHYEALLPTPDQIIDGALQADFVTATRTLYDRFGTAARRGEMENAMRQGAITRFKELVNQEVASDPEIGDISIEELREISPDNKSKLDKAVAGEMNILVTKASDPQLDLIRAWIHSERATNAAGQKIKNAWEDFVKAQPADRQAMSDRFVNLKVLALGEMLSVRNAPLQEQAVRDVL